MRCSHAVRAVMGAWMLLAWASGTAAAEPPLVVAAASDLQSALPVIAARFEKDTGRKATLTFGSSGHLFTQIQNGAPFDIFLSADIEYPRRLERAGLTAPGSLFEYATGRLALWLRADTGLDLGQGLSVLLDPKVQRIAIANPEHAPYGRAAVAALRQQRLYDAVRHKLVLGENISQAAQFAQSGNAQAGLLALSVAMSPALKRDGAFVEIPDTFYPPIQQGAIIVGRTRLLQVAEQFIELLKAPEGIHTLRAFGFAEPRIPRR